MNTFAPLPTSRVLIQMLLALSCLFTMPAKAQFIQIDSTFTADGEIFPFGPNDTIYGLSISGTVHLFSDTSLVRVLLSDNYGNEWMVYEAYPMINPDKISVLLRFADETKYLFVVSPVIISINIIEASILLDSIFLEREELANLSVIQDQYKQIIESQKTDSMTYGIERHSMLWFAHQNNISDKSYQEKKILFGEKYNLQGLDYYTGGIFDGIPGVTGPADESELVKDFD